jgi:hypothetical protein
VYSGIETMEHSKVPLPKPTVPPGHPFRNKAVHDALLRYLQQRLLYGKDVRDTDLPRLVRTDKKISGWVKLSQEDRIRQQVAGQGRRPCCHAYESATRVGSYRRYYDVLRADVRTESWNVLSYCDAG